MIEVLVMESCGVSEITTTGVAVPGLMTHRDQRRNGVRCSDGLTTANFPQRGPTKAPRQLSGRGQTKHDPRKLVV